MIDVVISLEATCDLSKNLVKEYDLKVIDMVYTIEGKDYSSTDDGLFLYKKMKEGFRPTTSKINEDGYYNYFKELAESNKPIIHLAFSSALSSTYEQALLASKRINEEKIGHVIVIDSLSACSGQGLLGILARRKANEVNSLIELVDYIQAYKFKLSHSFTVDNLKYLAEGGRIKKESAAIGNFLTIKPVMKMDNDGRLIVNNIVISRKRSLMAIANQFVENHLSNDCIISHADAIEDALYASRIIKDKTGVEPIITNLGPIIGSHSGPGTIAIFYISSKR